MIKLLGYDPKARPDLIIGGLKLSIDGGLVSTYFSYVYKNKIKRKRSNARGIDR